jgi:hypothetical protein
MAGTLEERQRAMREGVVIKTKRRSKIEPVDHVTDKAASESYVRRQELKAKLHRSTLALLEKLVLKERAVQHKGGKCQLCGYNRCMRALEFHHLDRSKKEFTIAAFISTVYNKTLEEVWSSMEKELKKCVLLCANCHREVESGVTMLGEYGA